MKYLKKTAIYFLIMVLLVSLAPNVSAHASSTQPENSIINVNEVVQNNTPEKFTKEEILALEEYVTVSEDGLFVLNYNEAKTDGFSTVLLDGQQNYFNYLNSQIENGELTVKDDLTIEDIGQNSFEQNIGTLASCKGKNAGPNKFWWGYSAHLNSCSSNTFSADLNSVAAVSTGVAVVAAYFGVVPAIPPGLSASYFWLLASRVDANNKGKGVFIEMTWALVFDITPQK